MFRLTFLCLMFVVFANSDSPKIQISSGEIEGQNVVSEITNKTFFSFRGIPYAEPPIGNLRFQPPIKVKSWTKTLETKTDGAPCLQAGGGSEDCLFINVYTPQLPSNKEKVKLLPVMVFIHGGAFVMGSSSSKMFAPDFLIDHDVILVTMNYRLNIFGKLTISSVNWQEDVFYLIEVFQVGFLNAMEESAPGNAGLKDLVFALEWVKENIEKFNGNPNKVTIFGESAGSAAVQYLVQSKLAKGLFHGAIMESGSTLNNWAFEYNPVGLIQQLGKVLNLVSKNVTELVNSFQNMPSDKLFNASSDNSLLDSRQRVVRERFVPSLEYESPKAFMTENSYSILEANKINSVPMMIGYNSNEAIIFLFLDPTIIKFDIKAYEKHPTLLVPKALNINNDTDSLENVLHEIKNHYFPNVEVVNKTAFVNFKSDEMFVRGIRKTIEFLRKDNDIYFYIFDYKKDFPDYPGVSHAAELKYLFYDGAVESDEDRKIREKMTTLWTNFAKTGNPTPKEDPVLDNVTWPQVSKSEDEKLHYLYINKKLKIKENPWEKNYKFWEKIFKKYGKTPFLIY